MSQSASPDWDWVASPNFHVGRKPKFPVIGVIVHYTAGSSREATVNYFNKKEVTWTEKQPDGTKIQKSAKVSASSHLVIGRDGKVTQMVSFEDRAWHAGDGIQWLGKKPPTNINDFTIGIEICNWGRLEKRDNTFFVWRPLKPGAAQYTTPYTGPTPIESDGKWWEPYTDEQIVATIKAIKLMVQLYPAIVRENVTGHQDVSPIRKEDPGGAFPWATVLEEVFRSEPAAAVPVAVTAPAPAPAPEPASSKLVAGVIGEIIEETKDAEDEELHHQLVATSKNNNRQKPQTLLTMIFSFILGLFHRKSQ